MENIRKIIHIDMDAFYTSIEQRDHPEYRNKPLAVGGSKERGVVAAASYEARSFGIHSAMSSKMAYRKCPDIIFVKPRFEVYKEVSRQIMNIFFDYTDLVEPLSIDEAYMDVTRNKKDLPSATLIAKEIKKRIKEQTKLTASAGISINKFLAKIASDYRKPDGLFIIKPEEAETFIENLPIGKFVGVGKVTAKKMYKLGLYKGIDIKRMDKSELIKHFGKAGDFYFNISRAIDLRPVNPHRIRKSVGTEITFEKDLTDLFEIISELYRIELKLMERMKKNNYSGKTLTLKIKFANFEQITRSKTYIQSIDNFDLLHKIAKELLYSIDISNANTKIRLLGLTVSNFIEKNNSKEIQLTLDL